MIEGKKRGIVMMVLAWLVSTGLTIDSYSQEKQNAPEKPVLQEQSQKQQLYKYSSRQRVGLTVIPDLSVDQATYSGLCPTVFTFKAHIYSNRAITLRYKLVASNDQVPMEFTALTLKKDERKEIIHTLKLGDPAGPPEFNVQAHIEVVYVPTTKKESNTIAIRGKCTNHDNSKQQSFMDQQGDRKRQAGPGVMPMPQPGQKELMPGESPMMPGSGKGQAPGNLPMP